MAVAESSLPVDQRRVTPAELLRMQDNSTMELVDGRVVEKHVSMESSEVELVIAALFRGFLATHPVARAFPASLGYQCFQDLPRDRDRVRKPDCTVVLIERLRALAEPDPGYMPIVPDLAVEVWSPNDTHRELKAKLREYRMAGFPLVWVVDPDDQTVTVYPRAGPPILFSGDDEIRAESAMPGFTCKVSDLFPTPVTSDRG